MQRRRLQQFGILYRVQRCEHPCGPAVTGVAFHHSLFADRGRNAAAVSKQLSDSIKQPLQDNYDDRYTGVPLHLVQRTDDGWGS